MGSFAQLTATIYYPHKLAALRFEPSAKEHSGSYGTAPNWLKVLVDGGPEIKVWVDPREHYLATIEASAILDLSQVVGARASLGLAWALKRGIWTHDPKEPFGVGNLGQALVPGRDYAHNHYPHGTMLSWGVPEMLTQHCRAAIYKADRFGGDQPRDRIDLFVADGAVSSSWGKRQIQVEAHLPWDGVSGKTVLGAQQALNALGARGADGRQLREDDAYGPQTAHALESWIDGNRSRFLWGVPAVIDPRDPEIYYQLRAMASSV